MIKNKLFRFTGHKNQLSVICYDQEDLNGNILNKDKILNVDLTELSIYIADDGEVTLSVEPISLIEDEILEDYTPVTQEELLILITEPLTRVKERIRDFLVVTQEKTNVATKENEKLIRRTTTPESQSNNKPSVRSSRH